MSPLPPLADFRASSVPAVVILGNDAILAALPATPVQLAHACLAAGFRAVIPASWGDELVAGATLDALSGAATRPAIHCACPHVARRVLAVGSELAPHLISLVAPPVAAARYLRANSVGELRVTYVGRCPSATDDSIDARLTPEELLAQLADRGIDPTVQPEVFESVLPPDRRRHLSTPGGLPSAEALWSRDRVIVEPIRGDDFAAELVNLVLAGKDALIDPAPSVGCVCAGATRGSAPSDARMTVVALEPPRSAYPVVEDRGALSLELPLPSAARGLADLIAGPAAPQVDRRIVSEPASSLGDAPPPPPVMPNRRPRLTPPGIAAIPAPSGAAAQTALTPPRRRSPTGTPRVIPGAVPVASDSEGRMLPRAYVARRRSPRSGVPVITDPPTDVPAAQASAAAERPTPREPAPRHTVSPPREEPRAAADSERPVVRSVEPIAATAAGASAAPDVAPDAAPRGTPDPVATPAAPASALAVRQSAAGRATAVAAASALVGAQLARGMLLLRKRSWLVAAGAIAGTGLLLGAVIGYAVAHRRGTAAAVTASDRGFDSLTATGSQGGGVRESVSAGGIAPATPNGGRRTPTRAQLRSSAVGQRAAARAAAPPADDRPPAAATTPVTSSPAPVNPPVAVGASDSSAAHARRDSIARADSLAAERESIRQEIERRRVRLDSIERTRLRLDSIERADQAGNRPRPPAQ